jgi:hypothetical protein
MSEWLSKRARELYETNSCYYDIYKPELTTVSKRDALEAPEIIEMTKTGFTKIKFFDYKRSNAIAVKRDGKTVRELAHHIKREDRVYGTLFKHLDAKSAAQEYDAFLIISVDGWESDKICAGKKMEAFNSTTENYINNLVIGLEAAILKEVLYIQRMWRRNKIIRLVRMDKNK